MLNLTFTLNGEAAEDTETQARGIVAALVSIYGVGVLPAGPVSITHKVGQVLKSTTAPTVAEAVEAHYAEEEPDAASVMMTDTPTVPSPPAATNPYDRTGVDRDVHGIPYDARIHSDRGGSTGGKNQDGSWKRKRNTPDDLYASVMAELKGVNTAHTLQAAAAGGVIPLPPGSAATTTGAGGSVTFASLMKKVTQAQDAKTLSTEVYNEILANVLGVSTITALIGKPDELAKAYEALSPFFAAD